MKNFKVLSLILAMVLILSVLAGCGETKDNGGSGTNNEETSSTTSTTDSNENNDSTSAKDAFIAKISGLVDTSKYEFDDWTLKEGYGNSVEYTLESEYTEKFNFDYVIKFGDGSSIKLPTTFSEMAKTSWKTETEGTKQISNKVQTGVNYTNSDGDKFILWTQNFAEGDESYKNLSDCKFYAIDFETRNLSKFDVCGGITEKSSLEDIIKVLGSPSNIDFDMDDDEIQLTFREKLTNWYSEINIYLDGQGNSIAKIKYEYSYADL